jgi:hypothetical protein
VYVANNPEGVDSNYVPFIMKIDNLYSNTYSNVLSEYANSPNRVTSLAIDRRRNFLYYLLGQNLQRLDLTNDDSIAPAPPAGFCFDFVAVDKQSMVYLSGWGPNETPVVAKYDIQFNDAGAWEMIPMGNPQSLPAAPADILIRDDYLLVLCPDSEPGCGKIFKMDLALSKAPVPYGDMAITSAYDTRKGYFYHPEMFLAASNRKIYLIDDGYDYPYEEMDRIVAFDNPDDWLGWSALRGSAAGPKIPFGFYYEYLF